MEHAVNRVVYVAAQSVTVAGRLPFSSIFGIGTRAVPSRPATSVVAMRALRVMPNSTTEHHLFSTPWIGISTPCAAYRRPSSAEFRKGCSRCLRTPRKPAARQPRSQRRSHNLAKNGHPTGKSQLGNSMNKTHGLTHHPSYLFWKNMIARCYRTSNSFYKNYGGRGIMVCDRWLSIENFIEDMGEPPGPGVSLERKDCNLDYTPENCTWIPKSKQAWNRRDTRRVRLEDGRIVPAAEAARILGISDSALLERIQRHGTIYNTRKYTKKSLLIRFQSGSSPSTQQTV